MLMQASIETVDELGSALPSGTTNYCSDPGVAFAVNELSDFLANQMGPPLGMARGTGRTEISTKPSKVQSSFTAAGV